MATSTHFIELLSMWILDYMQGIWGARHAAISAACPPPGMPVGIPGGGSTSLVDVHTTCLLC